MKNKLQNKGFVILMSMLIITAVTVAIASSLVLLGLDSSRSSFSLEQSYQAKALADLCAEEALQVMHGDTGGTGIGTMTEGLGDCKYEIFNLGGDIRRIDAQGSVGDIVRRVVITTDSLGLVISTDYWQEVGDF